MFPFVKTGFIVIAFLLSVHTASAQQADEICSGFGLRPSFDEPGSRIPYVFGRISVRGLDPTAKSPKITAVFLDAQQSQGRLTIERSGNYCFRRSNSGGGTLIIEVDGVESARKAFSTIGQVQTREDFEVYLTKKQETVAPGVVSAKFRRPPNEKTEQLYQKTGEADANKDLAAAIRYANEIVAIDPDDFVAWAKLGSLHAAKGSYVEAETALKRSLAVRKDYTPAMLNLGLLKAL